MADILRGGEMGERIRAFDWSGTPVGPAEGWPQSLRTAVSILLGSRFPMFIWWGRELTNIYNDAYIPILGARHPEALGRPARESWADVWPVVGPQAEAVTAEGRATWNDSILLLMERHGFTEETYFTFSYSPAPDDRGGVGGVFCAVTEETDRVIGERRLRTLRDLGARGPEARSAEDACRAAAAVIADNPHDIPFALIYLLGDDGLARLTAAAGLEPGSAAAPRAIEPGGAGDVWSLGEAPLLADGLEGRLGRLPAGPWADDWTRQALVLPLARDGAQERPAGFLVAGVSPRLRLGEDYLGFLDLTAGHIASAVAGARAYEAERKRAEALAELDRAKTAFFSNVSHEFRTPLTLLLGPIDELLQQPGAVPPEARGHLEVAQRAAQRLLRLVNTLLDFTRIEADRAEAAFEPTDLAALTAELASVFRSAAERAGLALVVDCPPLPEPIFVDREMWEQVVLNLLSNALKFTLAGSVTVALRPAGGGAELTVRDTGVGIAPDDLPHIFERFYRARDPHGRTIEGSGIGLALVQELVRLHGGSLGVESEPGRGSTFRVRLPGGAAHLPAGRAGAPRAAGGAGRAAFAAEALRWLPDLAGAGGEAAAGAGAPRILLADDNADMRAYLRRLLASDYEVAAVGDGAAALEAARAEPPDLLLADVMMPRLGGLELVAALRADERTRALPVILLSARAGEEARIEGMSTGADDYVVKPFSARELLARIEARIEIARVRRDAVARERGLRERAEEASRLKDEFLATVSHELRTPLTAFLGYAQLLRTRTGDQAYVARTADRLVRSAQAQAQLIDDLLDVSRIVSGKLRLEVEPLDLAEVVRAAVEAIRPAVEARSLRLLLDMDPEGAEVLGDPGRLQQVVWNLLSNAAKFTPPGGAVEVRLARGGGEARLTVSDTGQGISADFLPHVFEQFRQADGTSQRAHGGLGIGLAIVRRLVELHGGAVRAESEGDGRGATFAVALPLAARTAEIPAARAVGAPARSPELRGLRALLVDDEPDILDMLAEVAEQAGVVVRRCSSAREALALARSWRPDVVVSDIAMPGEDGLWLIEALRALPAREGGATPAAALTAYVRAADRARLLAAGFQLYIPKPVEPDELLAALARLPAMSPE